jgi:putative ABC transport system permease protein
MLRATLKSLLSRKLRLFLSGLAVVLGVMFVSGAFVLTDTIGRSFDQLISDAFSTVDVVVTGEETTSQTGVPETAPIPASVVDQIEAVPEVDEATAVVWAEGARVIDDDTGKPISTFSARLGTNWYGEDELIELRDGSGPTADDEVAINAALADAGDISVGDRIGVLTREPRRDFTVVGIFGYSGGRDSLFGETQVAFITPVAQELMVGQGDVYTEVDVQAADGVSPVELRDAVTAQIGDGYVVQTGEEAADEQSEQLQEGLSFFTYILLGFAGVAMFVGVFLVLNTFSIIVAQRLRELALMRAIGASRDQLIYAVLLEATVIGLLASIIGIAIGVGVGAGLAAALVGLFGGLPLAGVGVPPMAIIAGFGVGLVFTLLAALFPAWRASRVPPIAAMQEAATPDRPLTRLTVSGVVVTLLGAAALAVSLTGNASGGELWLLLAGVLLAFVGVALLTPLFARPVVSVLGKVFAWSTPGELGRRNTGRNPRRTAITAAALMVGVALVTGISTIFSSATASINRAIDTGLRAELIISGEQTTAVPPSFDPAVLEQTRALPDVAAVAGVWFDLVELEGSGGFISAADDLPALREMAQVPVVDGSLDRLASGQLVIDDRVAEEQGLAPGDRVPITLPRGDERSYTVVGVYERTELMQGFVISAEDAAGLRNPNPTQGFIQLREGADADSVQQQVERLLADSPEVVVQDQSGFVEQQTRIFDQILLFVQILLVLAMVIAVLGVVNTLVLSVLERTRELGLLRAVGLSRGATMRMVTVESVVISLFGALLGIVVGTGLGAAVVRALRDEGFTHLALPWTLIGIYLVVAAIVGVVAAVIPAIRAARLNVLAAIAYE